MKVEHTFVRLTSSSASSTTGGMLGDAGAGAAGAHSAVDAALPSTEAAGAGERGGGGK